MAFDGTASDLELEAVRLELVELTTVAVELDAVTEVVGKSLIEDTEEDELITKELFDEDTGGRELVATVVVEALVELGRGVDEVDATDTATEEADGKP